ncbi:MAG: chloride channel protein [Clostridia bacterium]|nr:chloride channel protein [Clostridia bacterium]
MAGKKLKAFKNWLVDDGLNIIVLSIITGVLAGIVVTFYNILTNMGEDWAKELYDLILGNLWSIPLLFIGLACAAIIIGTVVRFVPMVKGSGIPQTEGAARGIIKFKWYVTLVTMFAASLACICCGLSAGSEGPSLEIGACCGSATAAALKRRQMVTRLQIAAGASAGLAVAFNAPVTGIVFAMEEAFHSFSSRVFISSAISVIFALLMHNALRPLFGLGIGFTFETYTFASFDWMLCVWVLVAAIVTSLIAVGFYYLMFYLKKLMKKVTFLKGTGKFLIPFLLAGAFGLITAYAIGGGHSFIMSLGTGGTGDYSDVELVFGLGLAGSLVIIVIIRFIACALNMSCGVPCGAFIPMLTIGAGLGAIISVLFKEWGMDPAFCDFLVIVCMSVFFTTCVRAPITGVVMIFELTGQFSNLLPAIIAVAIAYYAGRAFHMKPIYEKLLDQFIEDEKLYEKQQKYKFTLKVMADSSIDGNSVRSIIWPTNSLVVALRFPDGTSMVPDGETVLKAGDVIDIEAETDDEHALLDYLAELAGDQPEDVIEVSLGPAAYSGYGKRNPAPEPPAEETSAQESAAEDASAPDAKAPGEGTEDAPTDPEDSNASADDTDPADTPPGEDTGQGKDSK